MTKIITIEKDEEHKLKDENFWEYHLRFSHPEQVPLQTVKVNPNRSKGRTHIIIRPRSDIDIMTDTKRLHEASCGNSHILDENNQPDSIDECMARVLYNRCIICDEKEAAIKLAKELAEKAAAEKAARAAAKELEAKKESEKNGNNK